MATTIQLSGGHQFIDTFDVVTVIGTTGTDSIALGPRIVETTVFNVEAVEGSNNFDTLVLGASVDFLTVSGVENIIGSNGYDAVALAGSQSHLMIGGVESLTDLSGGFQTVQLSGSVNNLTVHGIEQIYGSGGHDTITLGTSQSVLTIAGYGTGTLSVIGNASFNTLTIQGTANVAVSSIDAINGDASYQAVTLTGDSNTLTVDGIEKVTGGSGYDAVTLAGSQSYIQIAGIDLLSGGSGVQTAFLTGSTAFLTVNGIEAIYGDAVSGSSTVVLGDGQADIAVQSVDQVIGNSLENTVYLNSGNKPLRVSGIEHVVGAQFSPNLILGDGGNTTTVSNIGTVIGGLGYDAVTMVGSQQYITVSGIEFLGAGAGFQTAFVADSFALLTVNGVEAVYGTSQGGFVSVTLGDEQTSVHVGSIDAVIGNNHDNTVFINGGFVKVSNIEHAEDGYLDVGGTILSIALDDGGNTLSVTSIETIIGGAGYDAVTETMYDSYNQISGVESFTATGGGYHSVSVINSIANLTIQGVTSLTGDAAYQSAHLVGSSSHLTIAGIDALYGTAQSDTISVSSGPAMVAGGAGADTITLSDTSWDPSSQIVAFASGNDGSGGGVNSGFDTINNFDAGNDKIAIQSGTSLFSALDKDGAGLTVASRAKDGVDMSSDEIVVLTTTVSGSLTDSGYQNFRTALGSVVNDQATSVVVAATNGTDTGIYLVHSDYAGGIGASEVSLLGLVSGTTGLTANNFMTVSA